MSIIDFIKKYGLFRTFFISELNETQLEELKSCVEFKDVKKFNIVNPKEAFYENNAIDFNVVSLKTNTKFNSRINIHSVHIIGPVPVTKVYELPDGFSISKTATEEENYKRKGVITFKFDYSTMQDKYLSNAEIKAAIRYDMVQQIDVMDVLNNDNNYRYQYLIGVRVHKDSIVSDLGDGQALRIPLEDIHKDLKLFS